MRADILTSAREFAAQVFDARARKAKTQDGNVMERHHAKVIRQGDGDDYDVVQGVVLALLAVEKGQVSFHDRPLVKRADHARHVLEIVSADRVGAMIAFSDQEHRGEAGFGAALTQQEKTDAE